MDSIVCWDCKNEYQATDENFYKWNEKERTRRRGQHFRTICKRCVANRSKEWDMKIKKIAFTTYGNGSCSCCGEDTIEFLSIDHIDNDGGEHRKNVGGGCHFYRWLNKNEYPKDLKLRVLCHNCNLGRQVNGGVCPHLTKASVKRILSNLPLLK